MVLRSSPWESRTSLTNKGHFASIDLLTAFTAVFFYYVNIKQSIDGLVVSCAFSTRVKCTGIASAFLPETARYLSQNYAKT